MRRIELDREARETLSRLLRRHLKDELDLEIDPTDAQTLLEYLSETLGPWWYNQGLQDAQAIVRARIDTVVDAVADLEQPVGR